MKKEISQWIYYKSGWHRVLIHSAVWLMLFGGIVLYQWNANARDSVWELIREDAFFTALDIIFTYTFLFLIDKLLLKRRIVQFFIAALATILIEIFIYRKVFYLTLVLFYKDQDIEAIFNSVDFFYFLYSIFFPLSFFSIMHLIRKWIISQAKMADLAKQNLQNELNLLKNQLNQHFLFNTLNNIDSLIYYDPDKASRTVVNLSGLLRYALYETNHDRVPMFQEIEYIRNYIDVFTIRMQRPDLIDLKITGDYSRITVAPMLFIPFIENALKYGNRSQKRSILIGFDFRGDVVTFRTSNQKKEGHTSNPDGLGISNVRRRLQLIYPDTHRLKITEDEKSFEVLLVLETEEAEEPTSTNRPDIT
ncbi:MAG: histidine kinase [Bacteroidales bacterium]|jgi:hypothetical protein|nr:histidine kinase [Bacteroidales bacterium]